MAKGKLTFKKGQGNEWKVDLEQGDGGFELKVEKGNTEVNAKAVTFDFSDRDGSGNPTIIVDP